MSMQFMVWGAGYRGHAIFNLLGENRVIAFIEENKELVGGFCYDKEIIDFQTYLKEYQQYFIIISPEDNIEIVEKLNKNRIYQYFLLYDVPSEFLGYGNKGLLKNLPLQFDYQICNAIYGAELISVLLYEKLKENENKPILIPNRGIESEKIGKIAELLNVDNIITLNDLSESIDVIYVTVQEDMKYLSEHMGASTILVDAYDFSDRLEEYHHEEVVRFKNIHKGKRCFIVGLGASLKAEDLDMLYKYNEISFSMNRIYRIFSDTEWRPYYYVFTDRKGTEICKKEILDIEVKAKFITDAADDLQIYEQENIYKINPVYTQTKFGLPKFSEDCSWHVYAGGTVTYGCIQLAAYMGFREIIMLGVDFDYSQHGTAKHFYEIESNRSSGKYDRNETLLAYRAAKHYADTHDIKILNATRGGKLEVFERVDFDSLF